MKFGILSQWFDPEPGGGTLCGTLARELSRRGHDVTIVTGFPNYPQGVVYQGFKLSAYQDSKYFDAKVRRVALYPSHDSSPIRRTLNYASFAASASIFGLPKLRGLDSLWVYNSPASIAAPMWTSKFLLGVPHVLHVMDLWPDSVFLSGFARTSSLVQPAKWSLDRWVKSMYRTATSIAYVSPGIGLALEQRGVPPEKLKFVPVWIDGPECAPDPSRVRERWASKNGELLLVYAGALGQAQGLDSLIKAISITRNQVPVTLLLAGSGTCEESLRAQADSYGLRNVRFLGQLPNDEVLELAAAADVHVVSLNDSPVAKFTMPSKLQTTLSLGKPFIAALAGDARQTALDSGAAFLAHPGDPASIASAILAAHSAGPAARQQMGESGLQYYRETFGVARGVDSVESLLLEAAHVKRTN